MKNLLILFLISISFSQCDYKVKFKEALPPDVEPLTSIPDRFLGTFICQSDSSRITVDKFKVYNESFYMFETSLERIRETENCSVVDGGLYLLGRKECIPFEYISEDSVRAKVYETDTIFSFGNEEVAKFYKGHLFISFVNELDEWSTWVFSPQPDGNILFEFIAIPDSERKIADITKNYITRTDQREKVHYVLNPTLIEFDNILRKEYLFECDVLVPVNIENMTFKNYK